jgi:uncharacterized protein (DUF58 family)
MNPADRSAAPGNPEAFHYRSPLRSANHRPGSHPGSSLGAGQEFATHMRLFDNPDPRRLDLRASLRDLRGDWLTRVHRQRAALPVHAMVDVSASMHFGAPHSKLSVAADFIEALGHSAFLAGDPVGMQAFDDRARDDLAMPVRHSRGNGPAMAARLRGCRVDEPRGGQARQRIVGRENEADRPAAGGLAEVTPMLAGRQGLVFVVSDFHWSLDWLPAVLDTLAHAYVVPLVVWHPAEIEPPARTALLAVRDMETGTRRTLWLRPAIRAQWRTRAAQRRAEIEALFDARGIRPFFVTGAFSAQAMSRYFLEAFG